jgi:hypothetical protein
MDGGRGSTALVRRLMVLVLAAAALVPLAMVAAGCGSDDLEPISAAEAAEHTRDAESARAEVRMTLSGMGLPQPMVIAGNGVTATAAPRMDLTLDLRPLLELAGIPGDGETRVLAEGGRIYVDLPPVQGLELPGGVEWVTVDLNRVVRAFGVDGRGLAELMRIGPEQQLDALSASGAMETVGQEEIDGVPTTHQRGTVRLSDFISALPADRRARARKAIRQLDKLPGGNTESFDTPTPIEMWVDEDNLLRRMTQSAPVPAQPGMPAGRFEMRIDFSDFGTELDITEPVGADVFDATRAITRELRAEDASAP